MNAISEEKDDNDMHCAVLDKLLSERLGCVTTPGDNDNNKRTSMINDIVDEKNHEDYESGSNFELLPSILNTNDSDEDNENIDVFDGKFERPNMNRQISISERDRKLKFDSILKSIIESEVNYLECLNIARKFMKAIEVNLTTSDPVIPQDDFNVIFFNIKELYEFHKELTSKRRSQPCRWEGDQNIGYHFKRLSEHTSIYEEYLTNYPEALATFHKCIQMYPQFSELSGAIKMQTLTGDQKNQCLSLEDLLNKPVAKVQKNSLKHLIEYTPEDHPDFVDLTEATVNFNNFLHEFSIEQASYWKPKENNEERELIKNSMVVELSEGSRKLRHLFLFSDALVVGKHKITTKKGAFDFQLKWYLPLDEV